MDLTNARKMDHTKIMFVVLLKLSYCGQNLVTLRTTSQTTERIKFRYASHKKSHSSKRRLVQKYVNA